MSKYDNNNNNRECKIRESLSYQDTNVLDSVQVNFVEDVYEIVQDFLLLSNQNVEHTKQVNQGHYQFLSSSYLYVNKYIG